MKSLRTGMMQSKQDFRIAYWCEGLEAEKSKMVIKSTVLWPGKTNFVSKKSILYIQLDSATWWTCWVGRSYLCLEYRYEKVPHWLIWADSHWNSWRLNNEILKGSCSGVHNGLLGTFFFLYNHIWCCQTCHSIVVKWLLSISADCLRAIWTKRESKIWLTFPDVFATEWQTYSITNSTGVSALLIFRMFNQISGINFNHMQSPHLTHVTVLQKCLETASFLNNKFKC